MTPLFALCILLLSVAAQAHTSDPSITSKQQELRRVTFQLSIYQRQAACLGAKEARLRELASEIADARKCLFNGLPWSEYMALREMCSMRRKKQAAFENCEKGGGACNAERKTYRNAKKACTQIGWDGSRPSCASLRKLKAELESVEASSCPLGTTDHIPGRAVLEARKQQLERMIVTARNLAPPAYELTVLEPEHEADSAVILLHGVGGTMSDVLPLARALQGKFKTTRYVLPQAPVQYVTFFNRTMPSWFNLFGNTREAPQAVDEILLASNHTAHLATLQHELYGIPRSRMVVHGISQGGALALTSYLRAEWGGGIVVAGFLALEDTYPRELTGADGFVVLMHGDVDVIVPTSVARVGAVLLRRYGVDFEYIEYPGEGHSLTGAKTEVISESLKLMGRVLLS